MSLADFVTGNRVVRSLADKVLVRFSHRRVEQLDAMNLAQAQERVLFRLLRRAQSTQFGNDHHFSDIRSIHDYQQRVPARHYEDFWSQYWQVKYPCLNNITWPGPVPYYALSSGTTSGTTKYIPISKEMLASNRKAAFTTLAFHRHVYPDAALFNGRVFFLSGNTAMPKQVDGSKPGDLSAIAAIEILGLMRPYTFPPLALSRIANWEEKLQAIAIASAHLPITVLSGVPAWMLVLFDRLKTITGKKSIGEIWPSLRLVIHGGTKFDPYRELFVKEIASPKVRFVEVYPCSEGFIATEDPRYNLLRIVPDHDIFFEFIPIDEFNSNRTGLRTNHPVRHTLATAEVGVEYAVVVTTCAGLWSYIVGDTIVFENRLPPLIRFTGRTRYFLSAFGEHLISEEIEKAAQVAASATGAEIQDHHVGPVFSQDPARPGNHRYLIEFRVPPHNLQDFASRLDQTLSQINEDYAAHRQGDVSMLMPEIVLVKLGGFNAWMEAHGKRPPQHKLPRMDNSGSLTQSMYRWLLENNWISVRH